MLVFLTICRALVQLLDLVGILLIGLAVSMFATTNHVNALSLIGFDFPLAIQEKPIPLLLGASGFFILKSALSGLLLYSSSKFLYRVEGQISLEIAQYIFSTDIERLKRLSQSELQWALGESTGATIFVLLYSGSSLVSELFLLVSIVSFLALVDLQSALLVAIFCLLVVMIFQFTINGRLKVIGTRISQSTKSYMATVFSLANAYKEITIFGAKATFLESFHQNREADAKERGIRRFLLAIPRYFIETSLVVGALLVFLWQTSSGTAADGIVTLGVFLAGGVRLMASLVPIQNATTEIRAAAPQAEEAQQLVKDARAFILNSKSEVVASDEIHLENSKPLNVEVEDIVFAYPGTDKPVIDGLSFRVRPGEFAAIIGPSGAGKTTLVDLILGFHVPSHGKVMLSGFAPRDLIGRGGRLVSYVPQQPQMISGTLAENVVLGAPKSEISPARVLAALEEVGLKDLIESLPDGINSDLGKHANNLSGGQLQRIGLARAIYSRPQLLVLDEPTSALDSESETKISALLGSLKGTTTIIAIAHRSKTIESADVVITL